MMSFHLTGEKMWFLGERIFLRERLDPKGGPKFELVALRCRD